MSKTNYKKLTEKLAVVAAVLQPLMTLPQVWQIYTTKDATGVSLITWLGFAFFGLVFLAYGIANNLRPIWLAQTLWFVLQMSVVIGILLYGN